MVITGQISEKEIFQKLRSGTPDTTGEAKEPRRSQKVTRMKQTCDTKTCFFNQKVCLACYLYSTSAPYKNLAFGHPQASKAQVSTPCCLRCWPQGHKMVPLGHQNGHPPEWGPKERQRAPNGLPMLSQCFPKIKQKYTLVRALLAMTENTSIFD